MASQAHASTLSDGPLFLGGIISPNVMFTLDDSGSMQFEVIPENSDVYFMFPRPDPLYGATWGYGSNYSYVAKFDLNNAYARYYRTAKFNSMYYNPGIRYFPWSKADGTLMPNATPTAAYNNPGIDGLGAGEGSRNLTVNNTQTARWVANDGSQASASLTFYPATYFSTSLASLTGPTDANNTAANFTKVEIKSANAPFPKATGRADCAGATCTYAEEIQNFANWYTYYRSRILMSRAGVGKAFALQGNTMRVGFATINKGSATIDGTSTDVIVKGVRQFTGTDRTSFFDTFYGYTMPSKGTPLRDALNSVGKYFKRTDDKGPWGETPGSNGGTQHACRQSYNILMTDGYYNDSYSGVGNADNLAGASITNHSSPATPATYTYAPALPYSDGYSDTLADVAMYYWKTDLRTNLDNKVPTNTTDPAFWQHLVNFTVGLGVTGSLPYSDPATGPWPNPSPADSPQKIDDLWHAAVNSRGGFYSAANPTEFANALSGTLSNIVARTGSASAVATSSSSLTTNGRLYQAKFNSGDWSGQLLSIPIDTTGTIGTTEWDAGSVINTLAPTSRVVLTKGKTGDGVAFEYTNLTPAQTASLDKNAAGTTDDCGLERVAYLRGDSTHEGSGGTFTCASMTSISEFRNRVNSKLGDIVNSSPYYVGSPSAGYSDVDHSGYSAFSGSSGYQGRTPMVYVGANDGTLHGFNACVAGVTPGCAAADEGKELIAYVPSMVYDNLSRLSDANYNANHRYFVDGSPMVADADLGTTGSPDWRSVLIGGMNSGGQGFFALDVTNPTDGSKTAPTFSNANAASLVLWEFTNDDDADMGYSYNLAPVDPFTSQARQIVQMENGEWAVVVGNGYNSTDGHAILYVLFLKGGLDGSWTLGTDYIKLVADSGAGNGLSAPVPFDSDGDGKADVIYAGDLKGNMWKFNVSAATAASWPTNGTLLFAAGTGKPITSPPVISLHPKAGLLVMFGTGKYLETGDTTSTGTQTSYGIWDNGTTVTAGQLVQQVVTPATTTTPMTSTQNPVPYSSTAPIVKGWYLNLPVSGERLAGIPALEDGLFNFSTIAPSSSPCDFGGSGWDYTLDYLTGGMLAYPAFDTNGDGYITAADGLSAGVAIGFAPGGVTRVRGASSDILVSSRADGTLVKTPATKGPATLRGRVNWREIVQ
jgi:type IV pilus assembly protein PilY1